MKKLLTGVLLALLTLFSAPTSAQELKLSNLVMPVSNDNIFRDSIYHNWCNSVIKGEDGLYHMVYARWSRDYTYYAWLTHSEVAHAVSENPAGPYRYVKTLISFRKDVQKRGDMIMAHNPKIKYFEGKYYIYYISTTLDRDISDEELIDTAKGGYDHPNWIPLRMNMRTYVASSPSMDTPFEISDEPLIQPSGPIENLTVNPAIARGADSLYYLIVKGDKPDRKKFERNQAVAVSKYPDRDFVMQSKPVIKDWDSEDMSLFYHDRTKKLYSVFHAHTFIGMMSSSDGINWDKAEDFTLYPKRIERTGGEPAIIPDRMERPFILIEDGEPTVLFMAIQKNMDTFIVSVPFK